MLYSWHPISNVEVKSDSDDLVGGFLSAIDSFATLERGEDIQSLRLKETSIIFEKNEDYFLKLTFVITTKDEAFIELLHSIIHEIMDEFVKQYRDILNKPFDGGISGFKVFDNTVESIRNAYGLDVLEALIKIIDMKGGMKSVALIEPKGGNILYLYAKHYLEKEKLSFLIPLILNSARLLYQTNLNEDIVWIVLNTARNHNLTVEKREKILIVKQSEYEESVENDFLSLDFFNSKDKYVKKPKRLVDLFKKINWDSRIKQFFLIDLFGKELHSELFDDSYDYSDYIPETVSFITSTKNTSEQIYNTELFFSAIIGVNLATICVNFNNFVLTMITTFEELKDVAIINEICEGLLKQLA